MNEFIIASNKGIVFLNQLIECGDKNIVTGLEFAVFDFKRFHDTKLPFKGRYNAWGPPKNHKKSKYKFWWYEIFSSRGVIVAAAPENMTIIRLMVC